MSSQPIKPDQLQYIADHLWDSDTEEDIVDFSENSEEEIEIIEQCDHNSESEQSIDDDFEIASIQEKEIEDHFYIGRDGETIWKSTPVSSVTTKTKAKNIIKVLPGPKGPAKNVSSELESFFTFITTEMIDNIVSCTNIYLENKKTSVHYQRERDCKLTSRAEIQALFGVLFLIPVKKGNHGNVLELWSKDGTGILILRAIFSYKRFLFLLRAIRFDDIRTRTDRLKTDKLAAIRNFYDSFVNSCKNNYNLGEFVTIDEMLHPFRGRCGFIQYMPQKPAKYGLKMYALCDSKMFYTWNFEIYCGTQHDGPYKVSNKPFDIVQRLMNPILLSTMDATDEIDERTNKPHIILDYNSNKVTK